MQFLINPATTEQLNDCGTEGLFEGADGYFYNYSIGFDEDTVSIEDSIGRMVPFDVTELDTLIKILSRINTYVKNSESVQKYLFSKLIQDASV